MFTQSHYQQHGRALELSVAALVFGVVLEAGLDPFEPAGTAWVGLVGGITVAGAAAAWYLSRESPPVLLSRYSPENLTRSAADGFLVVTLVVSVLAFALVTVWSNPPLYAVVLFPAMALVCAERALGPTGE